MLFQNKFINRLSILVSTICLIGFIYMCYVSFFLVKKKFIEIDGGTYVNQVKTDDFTKDLSKKLTKNCENRLCEVQNMLNYVTAIPYKINESIARSGKNVVKNNYGDCDDKSNLLISLLNAQGYEAYFLFVPKHVFIVVNLKQKIANKKALYINNTAFYILETTAKNSKIGFPLKYETDKIHAIINPFENKKVTIDNLEYKY